MRGVAALLGLAFFLAGSGCLVVGAVTATTIKTASKVTVATVETTGRVASAALTSSGEVTALTLETAPKLARTGMVVMVDASSGATTELPWQQGMQLYAAAEAGNLPNGFKMAKIFRAGRMFTADLKKRETADQVLQSGDVVELHRK